METKEAIAAVIKEDGIDSAIAWIAGVVDEKHSRIEQLEAALQGIFEEADGDFPDIGDIRFTARAALGKKKDE